MSDVYQIYLEIFRIVLPVLAMLCAFLWCRLYIGTRKKMSVLCELFLGGNNSLYVYAAQNIIGRAKSCDIRIPGQTVSRKHAMLYERENGWFLCPLDGEVLLNGEKIKKQRKFLRETALRYAGIR